MARSNRDISPLKMPGISKYGTSKNDDAFQVLQEMFHGKVEPEVVHMILSEMDWKVDSAIDTLLAICGESGDVSKKKSSLHKLAQDILCKKGEASNTAVTSTSATTQGISGATTSSEKQIAALPVRPDDNIQLRQRGSFGGHYNTSLAPVSTPCHQITPISSTDCPPQSIRNMMASTYGTYPTNTHTVKEKGSIEANPMSVDDDLATDSNLLSQSILSGALNLSNSDIQPEVSPLSPSKMYSPDSYLKDLEGVQGDKAYMDRYWPDLSGKMWPNKESSPSKETEPQSVTNIFPGMYTNDNNKLVPKESPGSFEGRQPEKSFQKDLKKRPHRTVDIRNVKSSLLERLGLAEKTDRGQLKNLQNDPEEDLDLNFDMETFDLENDDSSSDGSVLSHSGSAEMMTAELKNMLGLAKGDKKEPTMLESAARELERMNALSPNAKEFVPRSTTNSTSLIETKHAESSPKFLTPKCSLPQQARNVPSYTMVPTPHIRPVSVYSVPPHIPFTHQMVPVSLVGLRNVPPPTYTMTPPTNQIGSFRSPLPPPNILRPPSVGQVSSPSPPMISYPPLVSSPSRFPRPTAQQLASEAQQYATVAAQQIAARQFQSPNRELTPSPEQSKSADLVLQNVKRKIKCGCKLLIILRGLPGSGKSTLARELCGDGVIVSADDYFMTGDVYCYDQRKLTEAHEQCRMKAMEAVQNGRTPVIIDNTNTQVWEMCPYVDFAMSVDPAYEIEILEPSTPWKFKPRTLTEKSDHGVPYESIKRMLDRYQRNVTVETLLSNKNRSRPTKSYPNIAKTEPAVVKADSELTNPSDDTENIWEDVGALKLKNFYGPLMNNEDGEEKELEEENALTDENFPELKKESSNSSLDLLNFEHDSNGDKFENNNKVKGNKNKRKKKGGNQNVSSTDAELPNVMTDKEKAQYQGSLIAEPHPEEKPDRIENKGTSFIGLHIKPQKSLSSLQKQVEKISLQKTLVLPGTSASPPTVQLQDPHKDHIQKMTPRNPSLEKGLSEDKTFSSEIEELVDGLITEHVQDKKLSDDELIKVQDELKAYLHFLPIKEDKRHDAECLIEQKLKLFGQKSMTYQEDYPSSFEDKHVSEAKTSSSSVEEVISNSSNNLKDSDLIKEVDMNEKLKKGKMDSLAGSLADINSLAGSLTDINVDGLDKDIHPIQSNAAAYVLSANSEIDIPQINGFKENPVNKQFESIENESRLTDERMKAENLNLNDRQEKRNVKHLDNNSVDNTTTVVSSSEERVSLGCMKTLKSEEESKQNGDIDTNPLNDVSSECQNQDFWSIEDKNEKDSETSYWKNATNNLKDKPTNIETESSLASGVDCTSNTGIGEISSPNVWSEPKRQRKKNNRDDKKHSNNGKGITNGNKLSDNSSESDSSKYKQSDEKKSTENDSNINNNQTSQTTESVLLCTGNQGSHNSKKEKSVSTNINGNDRKMSPNYNEKDRKKSPDSTNSSNSFSSSNEGEKSETKKSKTSAKKKKTTPVQGGTTTPVLKSNDDQSNPNKTLQGGTTTPVLKSNDDKLNPNKSKRKNPKIADTKSGYNNVDASVGKTYNNSLNVTATSVTTSSQNSKSVISSNSEAAILDRSLFLFKHFDSFVCSGSSVPPSFPSEKINEVLTIESDKVKNKLAKGNDIKKQEKSTLFSVPKGQVVSNNGDATDHIKSSNGKGDNFHLNDTDITENTDIKTVESNLNQKTETHIGNTSNHDNKGGNISSLDIDFKGNVNNADNQDENKGILDNNPDVKNTEHNRQFIKDSSPELDLEVKDSNDISESQENAEKTKKKKKSNNKRKMAAKFPDKFLDDSVKEALLINDWTTQMPKLEGSGGLNATLPEIKKLNNVIDNSTSISSEDLKVLECINDRKFDILTTIDHPYKLLTCHDRDINIGGNDEKDKQAVDCNTSIPVVLQRDIGSMTDNMCIVGLDFLHSSFPYISEQELKDILEKCDGDVEWAVNLLLDWKYNLNLSEEESEKFVDVMFKAQHIPKSPVIHSSSVRTRHRSGKKEISLPSLQDMCYDFVLTNLKVDRQDIERQLISSSEKRLASLETQLSAYTKQYSFSSFGDEIIEEDSEFTEALLKELVNSAENRSLSSGSHDSSQVSMPDDLVNDLEQVKNGNQDADTSDFWNVELDLGLRSQQSTERFEESLDVEDSETEEQEDRPLPDSVELSNEELPQVKDRAESFGEATLQLPLKMELTKTLFSLFGPIEGLDEDKEELSVPVTLDVAKLIHSCLQQAFHKGQIIFKSDHQLQADEAYARQLQAEEDEISQQETRLTGPVSSTPQSSTRRRQQVVGLNIDKSLKLSPHIPKVVSLTEIMNEEIVKENEKKELVETLRQCGSFSLSTRLKQHKLYDQFPGIDQTVLDDIYQANCCNFEETVKAIQGSLGYNTCAPKTVMTKEAEFKYEQQLIDAAKQQSLQEMIDSCIQVSTPKVVSFSQCTGGYNDYEEFRGEANLHYRLRHECFQKAQDYHRKGMTQVASFYSEQGHIHTKKIKDANMKASEQILAKRHELLEKNSTLDLHGLHVDEAIAALERILPNREFELQSNPLKQRHYLIVITGKGNHSRGGVSRLKPAVTNYLRRNDYRYSEIHEGALRVSLKHRSAA